MAEKKIIKIDERPKLYDIRQTAGRRRVAVYARVSTLHDEQNTSLLAQKDYYDKMVASRLDWTLTKIYADHGISGTSTERRRGFDSMMQDARDGKIDLIITKSVSRFARNTVDSLNAIREMKGIGVEIFFEKEGVWTFDSKGEMLITLLSCIAQEESRNMSENIVWGHRKRYADGRFSLAYSQFLGYDKSAERNLEINKKQARVVKDIYRWFISGKTYRAIAALLTRRGTPTPGGKINWRGAGVKSILTNEKYKGDALLQKTFTVDYLTHRTKKNEGEVTQYYVTGSHEPIIEPILFDYVQEEVERRQTMNYSGVTPYSSKIICGECGRYYGPRPWHSTSYNNLVWQCLGSIREEHCRNVKLHDDFMKEIVLFMIKMMAAKNLEIIDVCKEVIRKRDTDADVSPIDDWVSFQDNDMADMGVVIKDITVYSNRIAIARDICGGTYELKIPKGGVTGRKRARLSTDVDPQDIIEKKEDGEHVCLWCGIPVQQTPGRKEKKFCSDRCRMRWWAAHREKMKKRTNCEFTCAHCGRAFKDYGCSTRKYCSHECYIADRFGR